MKNDSKVSNLSLELKRPLPGTETIKREGLEANNDDHWTHMGRYIKIGLEFGRGMQTVKNYIRTIRLEAGWCRSRFLILSLLTFGLAHFLLWKAVLCTAGYVLQDFQRYSCSLLTRCQQSSSLAVVTTKNAFRYCLLSPGSKIMTN